MVHGKEKSNINNLIKVISSATSKLSVLKKHGGGGGGRGAMSKGANGET